MSFDGIVLKKVIAELSSCLIGGKINKVFELNNNEIIIGIYSGGINYSLLCNISSSEKYCLTCSSEPTLLITIVFSSVIFIGLYFLFSI